MIQVITHCDRCNKLLGDYEGHGVQMWSKSINRSATRDASKMPDILNADICDGCRNMLDFFFVGKFREEVQGA